MEEHPKKWDSKRMADDAMHLSFFSKKRKLYCELEDEYSAAVESGENEYSLVASSSSGGDTCDDVGRLLRSPDLKNVDLQFSEGFGSEISSSVNEFLREATLTSEFCGDSEQAPLTAETPSASPKKPPPPVTPRTKIPASVAKMPLAAELDSFFAEAETYEQKRFAEKYNYDIVKDLPLKGRYQWVRLHS